MTRPNEIVRLVPAETFENIQFDCKSGSLTIAYTNENKIWLSKLSFLQVRRKN